MSPQPELRQSYKRPSHTLLRILEFYSGGTLGSRVSEPINIIRYIPTSPYNISSRKLDDAMLYYITLYYTVLISLHYSTFYYMILYYVVPWYIFKPSPRGPRLPFIHEGSRPARSCHLTARTSLDPRNPARRDPQLLKVQIL